jgi:trimeric autotransporter adhesin
MNKILLIVLLAAAGLVRVQAQELTVVWLDGQVQQYSVADIGSTTFGVLDSLAGSASNNTLCVHTGTGVDRFRVTDIDSIGYAEAGMMTIYHGAGTKSTFTIVDVNSMTYTNSSTRTVAITYAGATATVDNPLESLGVSVEVSGARVTVTATGGIEDIAYRLSGSSTEGMFKAYSDRPFTLLLKGLTLTNPTGPAINIQAHQKVTVTLADSTTSTIADGVSYAGAPNSEDQKATFFSEGQLVVSGSGTLNIVGRGGDQHGLGSDDNIEVHGGRIVVQSAAKDGIHTNDGYVQQGGSVEVTSASDGIDAGNGPVTIGGGTILVHSTNAGRDALKCVAQITVHGGSITLTVGGNSSKGLKAADIQLTGGVVTIQTSGGVVLAALGSGYDPSYCTAIKADNKVLLNGAQVTITTTGIAGRGVSSDGSILVESGALSVSSSGGGGTYTNEIGVVDAYHGPCMNADGALVLSGGTISLSHSGSGGKGIAGDGTLAIGTAVSSPTLQITTTGTKISIGGGEYAEAKAISIDSMVTINSGTIAISSADDAIKSKSWIEVNGGQTTISKSVEGLEAPNLFIKGGDIRVTSSDDAINATYGQDIEGNDGSNLTVSGGYVYLNAPTGDGMDSNGNLTLIGGTIVVHGPPSQPEVGLDVNGTFLVSGGFIVVSQINSNMVEVPSTQSAQRSVLLRTNQTIAGGTLFHIEDASGNTMLTFAPSRTFSSILFSSAALTSGMSYRVYTGGGCTGVAKDGLYAGGTYSGGTLRTTFTSTSVAQTVTF